jgi:hypothetical protein
MINVAGMVRWQLNSHAPRMRWSNLSWGLAKSLGSVGQTT